MARYKLKTLETFEDLTLKEYAGLISHIKDIDDTTPRKICGVLYGAEIARKIELADSLRVMDMILKMKVPEGAELKRIIQINGANFGLIPDFQTMELGAFTDITELAKNMTQENILTIFAILYRPVKGIYSGGKYYNITEYETEDEATIKARAELFGDTLSGEELRAVLDFFLQNCKTFRNTTPKIYLRPWVTKAAAALILAGTVGLIWFIL